jgi:ribosomal protein S12 methylthiotransferase
MPKKFHLFTLGCPKNEVDSEYVLRDLLGMGMEHTPQADEADVVIVNTCGFLQSALGEAREALRSFASQRGRGQRIVVFGCAVVRVGEKLWRDIDGVDAGVKSVQEVVEYIAKIYHYDQTPAAWYTSGSYVAEWGMTQRLDLGRPYAYVKIAEGCDQECSFCTIPAIKGPYRSREPEHILGEIQNLLERGIKEIVLIAQNTTAYGTDWRQGAERPPSPASGGLRRAGRTRNTEPGTQNQELRTRDTGPSKRELIRAASNLAELVRLICRTFPRLPRLRIMYAYPSLVTPQLIEVMATFGQVCHYLDLPLQHASPKILKAMRRPGKSADVENLIGELRTAIPDISIRSVFIVGFPGESEIDFECLKDFVRRMRFDHVGLFQYSAEAGTIAATLGHQVSEHIKQKRYDELMGMQQSIVFEINKGMIGREVNVLIEQEASDDHEHMQGRTYRSAPEIDSQVIVHGCARIGSLARVKITGVQGYDLVGELL